MSKARSRAWGLPCNRQGSVTRRAESMGRSPVSLLIAARNRPDGSRGDIDMSAVVKATRTRTHFFTRRETVGQRAQRWFREHAATLGRAHTPRWQDASKAVRDFWMEKAAHADDMA